MAFKKTFTVSTEDVNSHGFYVRTSGIDLSAAQNNCPAYIDHVYWDLPVGHWENLRKQNGQLLADLVIDGESDRENEVIRKIQNGDLKGASIGVDPLTWNNDMAQMKKKQVRPTLDTSELFEISVTALPSNKNALSLKRGGVPVTLNVNNINEIIPQIKEETNMKAIAVKLGLADTASESEIIKAIDNVLLSRDSNDTVVKEILDKSSEHLSKEQKEIFVTLSKTSAKQAIAYAEAIEPAEENAKEENTGKTKLQKDVKVSDLIKLKKGEGAASEDGKDSFDYLSKHNTVELARIKRDEPEKYTQLTRDYQKGVRYTGKTA